MRIKAAAQPAIAQTEPGRPAAPSNDRSALPVPARTAARDPFAPAYPVIDRMRRAFGKPFTGVRLRTDEHASTKAAGLGALAYTDGTEIGFAAGQYAPHTPEGARLIAHEFAHIALNHGPGIQRRVPGDPAQHGTAEADAERAAARIVRTSAVEPVPPVFLSDADLDGLVEELTDPELRRLQEQERQAEAQRKVQEAESDATRHVRLMEFRSVMAQKHYLPEDVRDYIDKYLTMRDLQVLKRFGFEFPTNVLTRYKIRTRVIDAIDRYHADWETKNAGKPAAQKENRQIDEFQAVVDADTARNRAAYDPQVAEAISGGIFGAIGYGIAGDEGAKAGAALDGILMGAGGIAEAKQSMPSAPAQRDPVAEVGRVSSRQGSSRTVPKPPATKPPISEPPTAVARPPGGAVTPVGRGAVPPGANYEPRWQKSGPDFRAGGSRPNFSTKKTMVDGPEGSLAGKGRSSPAAAPHTNSAGDTVARTLVSDEDGLLKVAENAAGGDLKNLKVFKEEKTNIWWQGQRPDGTTVKIEWENTGHANTKEGPHVTVRELKDPSLGEKGGWKVVEKAFIGGRETWETRNGGK